MTTLLYGSVIKLVSTEPIYNNKFFFVERLDDNELVYKNNISIPKIEYCVKFIDEKINKKISCPLNTKEIKIL